MKLHLSPLLLFLLSCSSPTPASPGQAFDIPSTVEILFDLNDTGTDIFDAALELSSDDLDNTGFDLPPPYPNDDLLLLSHIQMKGTHNSYHKWPPPGTIMPDYYYSMPPLEEQLHFHGIRQFELDIHLDPNTGELLVYHAPVFDAETTCTSLQACLHRMKLWSDLYPGHHALVVMIEPKDDVDLADFKGKYDLIENDILQIWPRERIIAPDDVRGDCATLQDAVLEKGWPTLGQTRDKALFVLLDSGIHRDLYLEESPTSQGRILFPMAKNTEEPFAAFIAMDDPVGSFDKIQHAVAQGFVVRTRSDTDPLNSDPARVQAAIDSGAQCLSTNFPAPTESIDWFLELPGGTPSRCNPISAPDWCTPSDIEH